MKFIVIIPARYASTRFPGKPLADLGGKTVIQRVYEQASKAVADVCIATDDQRIYDTVEQFGGQVVMTSPNHRSGTDRLYEAYTKIGQGFDVVINVQGDEPFIQPDQIEAIKGCFTSSDTEIATLVQPINDLATLQNPNSPKVVLNKKNEAIYFSRSTIPYVRGCDSSEWITAHRFYKHIGMYAYRGDVLRAITALSPSSLEKAENLEQLRWIENGFHIKVAITNHATIGIDTPEDLAKALQLIDKQTP
ncbi:MAG: 3-deoxy-manno-octulosonate cytidylyltransferase [Paludibacteraceae bacterium]|nr:3-deoxy-manno-octulosonate cytidylyltransferase [Paludibacteraceae bacterium]